MKNLKIALASLLLPALAVIALAQGQAQPPRPEAPMLGPQWAREAAHAPSQHGGSPDLTWHNGAVMPTTTVESIYWGPSWSTPSFVGDKITGLDSWYQDVYGTTYADTSNEYSAGPTGPYVTSIISSTGHVIDTSSVPKNVSQFTTPTLNEVCKMITNPVADGYYPVYVDMPRGNAGFCAYHSYGTCNAKPVQFAFFFNLDGDAGCDPRDESGLHSQGLAALANVTGHELSEARTDPRNGGWLDKSGAENADKCAWTFGTPLLSFNGPSQWKIQGNWSNRAYNNNTGYPNGNGQLGCIDGGNCE